MKLTAEELRALSLLLDDAERWDAQHGWAGRSARAQMPDAEKIGRAALRKLEEASR